MADEYVTAAQTFTESFDEWTLLIQRHRQQLADPVDTSVTSACMIPLSFPVLTTPPPSGNVFLQKHNHPLHSWWKTLNSSSSLSHNYRFSPTHSVVKAPTYDHVCITLDVVANKRMCRRKRKRTG
jgi:hypothetical protein